MLISFCKMFRIFFYISILLLIDQVSFGNEGVRWLASDLSDLTEAAEAGDAYAQGFLALCHLHGDKGLSVSNLEARFYAENSASRGHWLGNFVLGYLSRMKPLGPDSKLVAKYLLKSFRDPDGTLIKKAAIGDPIAAFTLAELFVSEEIQTILKSDMKIASEFYEISSNLGYAPACVQSALIKLHNLTLSDQISSVSLSEGVALLQKGIEQKLPAAHYYLGTCFMDGLGVKKDPELAFVHFQAAADRGYGPAMIMTAEFYANGLMSTPKPDLALNYIRKAVEIYQDGAEEKLEQYRALFEPELDLSRDSLNLEEPLGDLPEANNLKPKEPLYEAQTPSELAQPQPTVRLPSPYGVSTSLDQGQTTEGFALKQQEDIPDNLVIADNELTEISLTQIREAAKKAYWGNGSSTSTADAFKSFEKCANLGDAESARYLGIMYLRGKGVNKNTDEALKWFEVAARQGDKLAEKNLLSLRKIMKK